MKIKLYNESTERQYMFYILPTIIIFRSPYIAAIQFSWLVWTLEVTIWEEKNVR